MTPDDIAAQVARWINTTYPTGVAWMERDGGTVAVEWVDDSSTVITITVRDIAAADDAA